MLGCSRCGFAICTHPHQNLVGVLSYQETAVMEERITITDVDQALTHATTDEWRTWYEYIDKLLDQRLEAAST